MGGRLFELLSAIMDDGADGPEGNMSPTPCGPMKEMGCPNFAPASDAEESDAAD